MNRVKVYQIRKDATDRYYKVFEPYERVVKFFGKIDLNDYEVVWDVSTTEDVTLDKLFKMCNINKPFGYLGHSMSVSDIVELNGVLWYCNDMGWVKLIDNNLPKAYLKRLVFDGEESWETWYAYDDHGKIVASSGTKEGCENICRSKGYNLEIK